MGIEALLEKLDKVTGRDGTWTARCPAHDDTMPSLSIAETADKRILIHCHAGCDPAAVLEAVGMRLSDLFPDPLYHRGGPLRTPSRPRTLTQFQADAQRLRVAWETFRADGRVLDGRVPDLAQTFVELCLSDRARGKDISQDIDTLRRCRDLLR